MVKRDSLSMAAWGADDMKKWRMPHAVLVWYMDIKANCRVSEAKARAFAAAGMSQPLLVVLDLQQPAFSWGQTLTFTDGKQR